MLRAAAGLIAEILDGAKLVPSAQDHPESTRRLAASAVVYNALHASRACAVLLSRGYGREALATLERLKDAHRLTEILKDDVDGTRAARFVDGDELRGVTVQSVVPDPQATAVTIAHLPGLALVDTPAGPRPGFGFMGQANKDEARRIGVIATAMLIDVATFAEKIFRVVPPTESMQLKRQELLAGLKVEGDAVIAAQPEVGDL